MGDIDKLMSNYPQFNYQYEPMPQGIDGLNIGNKIIINSKISHKEQLQWLYEEIGHAVTSEGNITNYNNQIDSWQEHRARAWGMRHQVPKEELEKLSKSNVDNDYEIADDLGVQTEYLHLVGFMYGYHFKELN